MIKKITLILLLVYIHVVGQQKIHVHNDYNQNIPFWKSLSCDANAIEIDVLLSKGSLYVAHNLEDIDKKRTLENLYLKPLKKSLDLYKNTQKELQLLIDIKTEGYKTLEAIIKQLKKYPKIITNKNITIVISGNKPLSEDYPTYPDYIKFDYQNTLFPTDKKILSKIALISFDFKNYSVWNGKGKIILKEYKALKRIINKVHSIKKPIRFWATPDSKSSWKALFDLKVDFINTDYPFECTTYLKSLPKRIYKNTLFSKVYAPTFKTDNASFVPKNIILMIGDGNGLSQISSAALANNGKLTITNLKNIGLLKTQSADDFTTDSAASGTAIATGKKTYNRAIGVDEEGNSIQNIIELLSKKGFSSGIITTDEIFGATPAAFYAHQKDRDLTDDICEDLLNSKLTFFAGGGSNAFKTKQLKNTKFHILNSLKEFNKNKADKVGYFFSKGGVPSVLEGRKEALPKITKEGISFLNLKSKPFFLMVEGAQIDSYGHRNDVAGIISETIDFDKAVTEAIKFADTNKNTLVIILADHETSGFAIPQGNIKNNVIEGDFISRDHTGVFIPVFAYGPRSQEFKGCYGNDEVFDKILKVLNIKK